MKAQWVLGCVWLWVQGTDWASSGPRTIPSRPRGTCKATLYSFPYKGPRDHSWPPSPGHNIPLSLEVHLSLSPAPLGLHPKALFILSYLADPLKNEGL